MNIRNDDPTKAKLKAWLETEKKVSNALLDVRMYQTQRQNAEEALITHLLPANAKTDEVFSMWVRLDDGSERLLQIDAEEGGSRSIAWRSE